MELTVQVVGKSKSDSTEVQAEEGAVYARAWTEAVGGRVRTQLLQSRKMKLVPYKLCCASRNGGAKAAAATLWVGSVPEAYFRREFAPAAVKVEVIMSKGADEEQILYAGSIPLAHLAEADASLELPFLSSGPPPVAVIRLRLSSPKKTPPPRRLTLFLQDKLASFSRSLTTSLGGSSSGLTYVSHPIGVM
ncbi:hypothetical protein L7F22_006835 [Adiantum nelumboides]|nr:hypothetical protein [Adiantum nelumboides]